MFNFFTKNKVRVIIAEPNRNLKQKLVKPKDNTVSVDGKTFNINDNDFLLVKGIPTYLYNTDNIDPVNIYTGEHSTYNPAQFNTAIDNKLIADIFKASDGNKSGFGNLQLWISIGALAGVLIIGYLGHGLIMDVLTKLDNIIEALKSIGLEV